MRKKGRYEKGITEATAEKTEISRNASKRQNLLMNIGEMRTHLKRHTVSGSSAFCAYSPLVPLSLMKMYFFGQ